MELGSGVAEKGLGVDCGGSSCGGGAKKGLAGLTKGVTKGIWVHGLAALVTGGGVWTLMGHVLLLD